MPFFIIRVRVYGLSFRRTIIGIRGNYTKEQMSELYERESEKIIKELEKLGLDK